MCLPWSSLTAPRKWRMAFVPSFWACWSRYPDAGSAPKGAVAPICGLWSSAQRPTVDSCLRRSCLWMCDLFFCSWHDERWMETPQNVVMYWCLYLSVNKQELKQYEIIQKQESVLRKMSQTGLMLLCRKSGPTDVDNFFLSTVFDPGTTKMNTD